MTRAPSWAGHAGDALLVLTAAAIPLSTTGMQAGVLALGALSLASVLAGWGVVRRTPLDATLAVFFATLAVSTLASGHPLQASGWDRPWVVLAYFTVFWWLRTRAQALRVTRVLLVAGAVAAAYAILQHYTGADWYRAALGRATVVRPRAPGDTGFASVGFFRNYLTFAHDMLFPLAWAMAYGLGGDRLGLLAAPPIVLAIVFSTARGVWLATLALAATLAVLAGRRAGRRVGWALPVLAMVACAGFAASPDLREHAADMFARGGENAGRIAIYRANLDVVRDHPVLGLGFGRYQTAAAPYYDAHPAADRRSHAHSNYLQMAAEAGLIGLAAFVFVFAMVLRRGWNAVARAADAAEWSAAAGAWAALVAFLVGGVTQYTFGDNEVALAMWVTVAVLMRLREP